jgi:hypothetical protein
MLQPKHFVETLSGVTTEQLKERCSHRVQIIRNKAGSRGFTSGVEGPELG